MWGGGWGGRVTAYQDYIAHFEPSQSVGGAKMGDPREKSSDQTQAELGSSHVWPELEFSHLNHAATTATYYQLILKNFYA